MPPGGPFTRLLSAISYARAERERVLLLAQNVQVVYSRVNEKRKLEVVVQLSRVHANVRRIISPNFSSQCKISHRKHCVYSAKFSCRRKTTKRDCLHKMG